MPKLVKSKGFTMIELLVVITVIGILMTIGISTFAGVQAKGRDARRRSDIDEIRKAMELYYVGGTSTPYLAPTGNMFSDGIIPKDPKCGSGFGYILNTVNNCTTAWSGNYSQYTVCAHLEAGGGNANADNTPNPNGDFYCKKNAQ